MPITFKETLTTKNFSKGTNTCEFIILHHTGTPEGTIKGVLKTLTEGVVSCHFVVDFNGDIYKIGSPEKILWHCGLSEWKGKKDVLNTMNSYSIGIEVIGPLTYGFDDRQRKAVKELMIHLQKTYGIKKENILRHADLTWEGSKKGLTWDDKSSSRKVDIDKRFFQPEFKSFNDWKRAKLI